MVILYLAVTLGALMFILELSQLADFKEKLGLNKDSQILLINSEGNTDPNHFRRIVWDGLVNVPAAYKEKF
jgi:diaminopropionate ammonia-lyase